MNSLPTTHPAEVLQISPEALEVANQYLVLQDITKVCEELDCDRDLVTKTLDRPEVKRYVDQVFQDLGFNNRFKMRRAMDALISKKFEEMDEAGVGSSKDIVEILALSHKMTMEIMDREIALEKLKTKNNNIRSQVNVQINDQSPQGNYGTLLEKLMRGQS
jgi:hypothetical protein